LPTVREGAVTDIRVICGTPLRAGVISKVSIAGTELPTYRNDFDAQPVATATTSASVRIFFNSEREAALCMLFSVVVMRHKKAMRQ
jgi:hypothetical protein